MCSQCLSHTGPAPAQGAHSSGSRLLHQEPHAPPRSKPLRFRRSGSPQRHRLGLACILCPSQVEEAQVFGEHSHCDLSPLPSLLLSFLGVQLVHLSQADVDHPESQEILAKKPACSLVDDASLGPQLPPSGSGCLSLKRRMGRSAAG